MSALSRFEQFVEQFLEGGFTRLLRSQLQPVELAKRLVRAMEDSQAISTGGRIIVANRYDIVLNPQDFSLFEPYKATLERELAEYAVAAAKEHRLFLAHKALVVLSSSSGALPKRPLIKATKADAGAIDTSPERHDGDNGVSHGQEAAAQEGVVKGLEHTSRLDLKALVRGDTRTRGYLHVRGLGDAERIPINRTPFMVGRGLDNDLVLEDIRISRHHARLEDMNRRLLLVDLQSTNGTAVNGDGITRCLLANGDVVSFGGVEMVVALEDRA